MQLLARLDDLDPRYRPPRYRPSDDDLLALASMSRRLDGIPLAIELVAAFAATHSPSRAAQMLEEDGALLDAIGRPRGPVGRQATIRAALAWSVDLLEPLERELFQRVSVFVGPFTFEAACHLGVASGRESREVKDAMMILLEKSMIAAVDTEGPSGTRRYRLLETMRGYGLELLELLGPGAEATVRDHHALLPRRRRSPPTTAPRPRRTGLPRDRGRGAVELPGGSLVVVRPRGRRAGEPAGRSPALVLRPYGTVRRTLQTARRRVGAPRVVG